jgi:multiple sugar transport system ATP-binding protein
MAKVSLQSVSKEYPGGVRALKDLTLEVADGYFVVLLGPSGCGKTTTLRLIAGLEEVTSGRILLGDCVVNGLDPRDRDVAMVFQHYALYPHMTVSQNLGFSLRLRGVKRAEIRSRVTEVAALLGLERLLDRRPKALSGGERQRVALGRAIIRRPSVFLFDEPLSNLDAKLRLQTRTDLKDLHQHLGTTAIYVTHDQEEALTLGQRVAVMRDGEVQQFDEPLGIYDHPANKFVAGFVGTPTMNFVDGRVAGSREECTFQSPWGALRIPPRRASSLDRYRGRTLTLGIRPEHISLTSPNANHVTGDTVPATVRIIEPLGDRAYIRLQIANGGFLVVRTDSHSQVAPGDRIGARINAAAAHFFEPGPTGRNVSPGLALPAA